MSQLQSNCWHCYWSAVHSWKSCPLPSLPRTSMLGLFTYQNPTKCYSEARHRPKQVLSAKIHQTPGTDSFSSWNTVA